MSKISREKKAHKQYSIILKQVKGLMGHSNTTFDKELNGAGRKLLGVKFKGVFPSDKIPKLNDLAPYAILNLDKSTEPGSHWIALIKHGDDAIVYDSFGRDSKQIIPGLHFSGNGIILNTDDDAEQGVLQEDCGQRSLALLVFYDKFGAKDTLLI
jgi:hypothetical protein